MNAAEHFAWARERALEYVDAGDGVSAMNSLIQDLANHEATAGILHLDLLGLFQDAFIRDGVPGVRQFIETLAGPRAASSVDGG